MAKFGTFVLQFNLPICLFILGFSSVSFIVHGYSIRPATSAEVLSARKLLFEQAMNPFAISTENLLVASEQDPERGEESSSICAGLLGFGQIRPLDNQYSELASLYVVPERRNEGIGTEIVKALVERHSGRQSHDQRSRQQICLLTLRSTSKFYTSLGFREASRAELEQLPRAIQLEFKAGSLLSFVLSNDLICMVEAQLPNRPKKDRLDAESLL